MVPSSTSPFSQSTTLFMSLGALSKAPASSSAAARSLAPSTPILSSIFAIISELFRSPPMPPPPGIASDFFSAEAEPFPVKISKYPSEILRVPSDCIASP